MQVTDVPASHGTQWIRDAWKMFAQYPALWIALVSSWLLITLVLFLIPVLGPLVSGLLQPIFTGGLMLAAHQQEQGKPFTLAHLFAGFRMNGRGLMLLGAISLAAEMLVIMLLSALGLPDQIPMTADNQLDSTALIAMLQDNIGIILISFTVITLVKGVLWFMPPLLVLQPMSLNHALRWSFFAFVSNFSSLLIFGVTITLIYIVALLPWGLGLLVAMPVFMIANYTGYRDVFRED